MYWLYLTCNIKLTVMNQNTLSKVAGKSFEPTLNNEYLFTGMAVSLLQEINAWYEAYAAVATERDGYRFHIFYAGNGTHFKYDGPGSEYRCINLIVEHIESGDTWMKGCLIYRGAKQAKETIRRYRDFALKAPISEIEETRQKEKNEYPWRYFVSDGDTVSSIKEVEARATEKVA